MNIKILVLVVCRITGPAAAGSAGPVPTLVLHLDFLRVNGSRP